MDVRRFLAEFGHIANAPGGVSRLRQMVLHMAMHGQLVRQIPGEGHAADELVDSRRQMRRWMDEGLVKKERPAKDLSVSERPFEIPVDWVWCRVVDAGQFVNGRAFR